ncbi:alpha/beta fold hydrolase [Microbispora sp. GKU 823]|uniref:alpha/beta fold hydrolase n=1 Tax=Microbispora sp. GKU 823 TaxID=1652100 RepID=UPI0009C88D85|nr:alpha/beta fold hydrolase [Microbispora sp. GKU 823]OPG07545.1 hypothetical protein B1L11_30475 [Microbispora sp. GKU 823]
MSPTAETSPTIVLVHGAWHGAWAWDPIVPLLRAQGLRTRAVHLPGVGRAPGRHDLAGHAAFLRAALAEVDGPAAVCAHSYGGAVATEAAAAPNVTALVYLAAFQLEPGESCVDANKPARAPASSDTAPPDPSLAAVREGDYLYVSEAAARHMFYGGCTEEQTIRAAARITPEHVRTVAAPVTRAAWHDIPSTYVVCLRDQAIPAQAQRAMAERAAARVEIDTAHSPMLSHPAELTAVLAAAVRRDG